MFRILIACFVVTLMPVRLLAAQCEVGYYLDNGECKICVAAYYCPGDDTRKLCTATSPAEYRDVYNHSNTTGKTNARECVCAWLGLPGDETRNSVTKIGVCPDGPSGLGYNGYTGCRVGYYATGYSTEINKAPYTGCTPCTNGPVGSKYIGYGTPISDGAIEIGDNCPWKCGDGYLINSDGNACDKLCELGFTKLNTSTGIVVPLYSEKRTTPSINIGDVNGACHADLAPGRATGAINVMYNGDVYHTVSSTASLLCPNGYWLENNACASCGNGYYCPGDNTRHACVDDLPAGSPMPSVVSTILDKNWNSPDYNHANKPSDCDCRWHKLSDERRANYTAEGTCIGGIDGAQEYLKYSGCNVGYYAISPMGFLNRYRDCAACYNGPVNSHYTSYSTPSVVYAVESNCPWECDDGYVQVGDVCVAE